MKKLLLYGTGLTFSLLMITPAFAGHDKTDCAKGTTVCKEKKCCKGKCCKKSCTKTQSKS